MKITAKLGGRTNVLAAKVVRELRRRKLFITTVESCTGGGLANAITNIPGASDVIKAGFITYSNEQKIILGVPAKLIKRYTVYSSEVAESMAVVGLRIAAKSDVGVGITGSISRVDPVNPNSQPGVAYIAVKHGKKINSRKFVFKDVSARWRVKERIIEKALEMILETLG